jgi:hypothetical protein
MKSTVYRYSIYATITILVLAILQVTIIASWASFAVQEAAGYLSMLISMIFVFMGIRYYKDKVKKGFLSFGEGLKIGTLIVLLPAVFFGIFDILYTQVIDTAWTDHYYNHIVEEAKKTVAPEKLAAELQKIEQQKEIFASPVMQFLVMAGTVFIIGFIVTIISSLTLMKRKPVANKLVQ